MAKEVHSNTPMTTSNARPTFISFSRHCSNIGRKKRMRGSKGESVESRARRIVTGKLRVWTALPFALMLSSCRKDFGLLERS